MLLALVACSPEATVELPTAPRGNLLLVVLDDVGVDKVAAFSPDTPDLRTPTLGRIAAEGMRFVNTWAYPSCTPTRAALQTGRHARRTGQGSLGGVLGDPNELEPAQTTLAELVARSPDPYHTGYVGKWHLSTFPSPSGTLGPVVQGYERWTGVLGNLTSWWAEPPSDAGYYHWERIDQTGSVSPETTWAPTRQTDDALGFLAELPEPWFLQVSYSAAHMPWELPPAHLHTDVALTTDSSAVQIEHAILEAVDTELARLLAGIDAEVYARTTVVVLGDNGTPEDAIAPPRDPRRAKTTLFDGGIHVPLIVAGPWVAEPGASSDALVSVVDVFPTVAAIAEVDPGSLTGVNDPEAPLALDGLDLLPLLADPGAPWSRTLLYSDRFEPRGPGPYTVDQRAIRDADHKLVVDAITGEEWFFAYGSAVDEGPDLLPGGLDAVQEQARSRLRQAMDLQVVSMPFDAGPFVQPP